MGKEVAGDHLEIREWNPAGASPAQSTPSQQAGSESCMAMGWPSSWSVDSTHVGRVIEPRKGACGGGRRRKFFGRPQWSVRPRQGRATPIGVEERGTRV